MTLSEEIKSIFDKHNYRWRISGELQSPTAEDISSTISAAVRLLSVEDATASTPQIEIGGIIIQHNKGHYDVYVRVGETELKELK